MKKFSKNTMFKVLLGSVSAGWIFVIVQVVLGTLSVSFGFFT